MTTQELATQILQLIKQYGSVTPYTRLVNAIDALCQRESTKTEFTGYCDKDGKEIHDGDILAIENGDEERPYALVIWGKYREVGDTIWQECETWLVQLSSEVVEPLYAYCLPNNGYPVSVVGDRFNNPELVEEVEA